MVDLDAMRRCKMCGRMQPVKFHRTWLFFGKLYHGCKFCRLDMIKGLKPKNDKDGELF